ncbi:L-type lectin-domain containing protein [Carnobacterium maltaromaticum]|uniref:L-type lectin-domain containing protein n=1 Tax=Carnobacterium maltaromaticum TaxID=2751 RepID=UPI00295E2C0C|nr:leucine-rich repeat domain-containing protein [Carnobacterium maltaromaticum]
MKKQQLFLKLLGIYVIFLSLNVTVEASLPPKSLPIQNVFSVPKGANSYTDGNVTVVTKDEKNQIGSIFSTELNKLDLLKPFHAEMYVYLGYKGGNAADGMTFVMHNDKSRTQNFTGGVGAQLGVYARPLYLAGLGTDQLANSFAIEFDTYYNENQLDDGLDINGGKGHIAYAFPDLLSSYRFNENKLVKSLVHNGIYYPKDYLSNGKWHNFSVDWDEQKNILTYNFDNETTQSVKIIPSVTFGTTSVYWGFTGSTGSSSQESKVAFKQIPGLVNVSSDMKVTNDGKDITNTGVSALDGDIKLKYDVFYNSGKQNLIKPVFNLELDSLLSYKLGTLKVNGLPVSDTYFTNGKLDYKLPSDLSNTNEKMTISFDVTPQVVIDNDAKTEIKYTLNADNYFGAVQKTKFPIKKVKIVKSSDFENQSWLINEINRQLKPKKIDVDIYEPDLERITEIDLSSGLTYPKEHVPTTIAKLKNLTKLNVENLDLTGVLPEELGNLSKLTDLSIFGNAFTGGIPVSLFQLTQLKVLNLKSNNLTGVVPYTIGLMPNLQQLDFSNNQLVGQVPMLPENMALILLANNQLTFDSATAPSFLTSAKLSVYTDTFINDLVLTGNSKISSKEDQIQPFNPIDTGYFNLKVMKNKVSQELYNDHTYTIKDGLTGKVYYKGKKDVQMKIPYQKGILYKVILDEAEKNPNNIVILYGKQDEFKFAETPTSMSLQLKIGAKEQPVKLDGNLAVFDNRDNENWKLSITSSALTQGQQQLKGEYLYTSKDGQNHTIINGQKFLLEKGKSDSVNEIIPISNTWNDKYGLKYMAYKSNYVGNYRGTVEWTLENAP